MFRNCLFFLFVFINAHAAFFDWFGNLPEKAKRAKTVMEGFDATVEKALNEYQVPGLCIGIVVEGHLVYAKGYGFRDLEAKLPVTPDTIFPLASCTKAFTSFIAGTLIDEGLLSWDQLVVDVIPEFRLYDQYATQNLTMRDLLTHRSGLPRHDFMWYNSTMSREDVIRKIRYLEPSCDLREWYQYGNLMYLTAGYAMELLTGKSWETLVKERILNPLEMQRTSFSVEDVQKDEDFASPYIEKNGKLKKMALRNISLIGPGGSINSSVNDLSRWLKMQINGGYYEKVPLISPATLQEMHTPHVIIPGAPESKESLLQSYGIGWTISSYRGQYLLSHDGGIDGFTSLVAILPKQKVGIVILANKNLTVLPRLLSFQALDRVLELPYMDWMKEGLDGVKKGKGASKENVVQEDPSRKKGAPASHSLESYAGVYEHPGYGITTVECKEGKLFATYNGITRILDHWHYDVFQIVEETQDALISLVGTKISFHNNINGEIDALSIPFEPKANDIVFKKKSEQPYSTLSYLRRFIGLYEIYGYSVEIAVRNHALCAIIPGQPIYELVPTSGENEFSVKSMTGYTVRFVMDSEDAVDEVLLVQPYGAFTAKPKR